MSTDDKLDLVETHRLVDALHRRSESHVVVLVLKSDVRDGNVGATYFYGGNIYTAIGLATQVASDLTTRQGPLFKTAGE